METIVFLVWVAVNLIFLFNFHLSGGYLAIVNFAFVVAASILPHRKWYEKD